MIPMGEEVECHLSLTNKNFIHERFHLEYSRNFLFSLLSMLELLAERVKAPTLFVNKVKVLVVPNVNEQQASTLCHRR